MTKNTKPDNTTQPNTPGTDQEKHWKSLSLSFNKDFIKAAREKYDKRLQVA